jgi:hypothetical protein
VKESNLLNVYPNPADMEFSINLKNNQVDQSISIYTASGQLVKSIESNTSNDKITINTSSWKNGLYIVMIINKAGTQKEKVLVNHQNSSCP